MSRNVTWCFTLLLFYMRVLVAEDCYRVRQFRVVNGDGEILIGYRKTTNARLEVCDWGDWSTVCDDFFDIHAARNSCQALGLPYDYVGGIGEYGGGSGRITRPYCPTHDDCYFVPIVGGGTKECSHDEDVGLRCYEEPECEDGQTRLVTDQVDYVGLVELCVYGLWRSVCNRGWDYRETDVLCHQLNFNGWSFPVSASGLDVELHDYVNVRCKGNESELGQCEYEFRPCPYWGPAGAYCNNRECDHGATVLVGGKDPYHGRVEYCYEGQWYTLCADNWDYTGEEVRVVCQNIVYAESANGSALIDYYGRGENPILPFSIQCNRSNWELSQCSTSAIDVSQCSEVAGVVCETHCDSEACINCDNDCDTESWCSCSSECFSEGNCCPDVSLLNCIKRECESGAVRLVGGETDSVGALEVCISGIWGRVCQNRGVWNSNNAQVICRQLQYSVKGAKLLENSSFVFNSRRDAMYVLGGVRCVGTESEILECQHLPFGHHSCHNTDDSPVIYCKERESDCENGEVRLVDGEDSTSGYVEFCHDGSWGRVCSKGWDIRDTRVVCRQLNFDPKDAAVMEQSNSMCSGIMFRQTRCSGSEQSLDQCRLGQKIMTQNCVCVKISCRKTPEVGYLVTTGVTISLVLTLVLFTTTTVILYITHHFYKKRRAGLPSQPETSVPNNIELNPAVTNSVLVSDVCEEQEIETFLVKNDAIKMMDCLGKGGFGVVYKAKLSTRLVAVKILKVNAKEERLDSFKQKVMKLGVLKHANIMEIIGICIDSGSSPYIITPFMMNGNLLKHLRRRRADFMVDSQAGRDEEVTKRLVSICSQITEGMEYLAAKHITHGNLAASNCLINENFIIKITDYGINQCLFDTEVSRTKKNVHFMWMAPESLENSLFSEKSDMWSFGVTMWEIFSGGDIPLYPETTSHALLISFQQGCRLPRPLNIACTDIMYGIMKGCWKILPDERKSFAELSLLFSEYIDHVARYVPIGFNPLNV